MKFTKKMQDRNAFLIDLAPRMWTVILVETMGFYSVAGDLSPYWLNCLLGYLDGELDKQ